VFVVVMPSPGQPRTVRLRYGDLPKPIAAEAGKQPQQDAVTN
jgi:hypothetical protein